MGDPEYNAEEQALLDSMNSMVDDVLEEARERKQPAKDWFLNNIKYIEDTYGRKTFVAVSADGYIDSDENEFKLIGRTRKRASASNLFISSIDTYEKYEILDEDISLDEIASDLEKNIEETEVKGSFFDNYKD